MPPAGLAPGEVPLFVCFGSDDNGYSGLDGSGAEGGLHFLTKLFAGRRNPAGGGDSATFDGAPMHYSFYVNTRYLMPDGEPSPDGARVREDPIFVANAWREAVDAGHEIGDHTHSHPHARAFSVVEWQAEIRRCAEVLERPFSEGHGGSGLGISDTDLLGFRAPYLEYADATLTAAENLGFAYDCSLEEGAEVGRDGRDFVWPYRLDRGSPANPAIGPHPRLWEIPVYVFIAPPDGDCERLGVPRGFRARLKGRQEYFDTGAGKITGMDWNLWCEYGMTPEEFFATIAYTVELRLAGNRCPLTIGLHSELYSDRDTAHECNATPAERRVALTRLVEYLQQHEVVRIVSARELLEWLEAPVPLRATT